jgi:hypothetical protein
MVIVEIRKNKEIIVGVETAPRHYKVEPNLLPGEYVRAAQLLSESDYGIVKAIWTDECVAAYQAAQEVARKAAAERMAEMLAQLPALPTATTEERIAALEGALIEMAGEIYG